MGLPVEPPLAPMLARLVRKLPSGGGYCFEPKWDGFRALAFRDGDEVDIRSRHDRPLARYFPEVVEGLLALPATRVVLDGELLLLAGAGGEFEFARLMSRLHPAASRVELLRRQSPATYVAFDFLAEDDEDLRARPFRDRRARLEGVVPRGSAGSPVVRTPITGSPAAARTWFEFEGAGIDGVIAKPVDGPYEPGRRSMLKVKRERTADCVLAGIRLVGAAHGHVTDLAVSSLLLGVYDDEDRLRHVGVVTQLAADERRRLVGELARLVIPLDEHPWRDGFVIGRSPLGRLKGSAARWTPDMDHDWVPLRPDRVVEVGFDQVDGDRFRHPARLRRWRADRTPESCRIDQIEVRAAPLASVLSAS